MIKKKRFHILAIVLLCVYAVPSQSITVDDIARIEQQAQQAIAHDELTTACTLYKKILEFMPNNAQAHNNVAYALSRSGNNKEAIKHYQKTIELDGQKQPAAHLGLAKAALATGNFTDGWHHFEWRLANRKAYQQAFGYLSLKPSDIKGKKILIRAEWGLGDMMQFMRYAQLLKQDGATVFIQAFDPLIQLLKRCPFFDHVISISDAIPKVDIQIPLLSMPLFYHTELETIPASIPYMFADPALITHWHKQLAAKKTKLNVGLCWHAKPIYIEDHRCTRRSIPLAAFSILAHNDISFYSLQKEHGTDELKKINSSSFNLHTFDDDFDVTHGRFADTAAVIMNMDLIISADTSIVHLAGALGKQVWVLLPYAAEWRWLPEHPDYAHASHTPWYPHNMRLFKQQEPGNWTTVLQEVKQELITLLKKA